MATNVDDDDGACHDMAYLVLYFLYQIALITHGGEDVVLCGGGVVWWWCGGAMRRGKRMKKKWHTSD